MKEAARRTASLAAVVFGISTLFPIAASIWPAGALPTWVGILDVVLAFAVVGLAIRVVALGEKHVGERAIRASNRIYRGLASVPLGLLVLFFVFGDRINWKVLLPGLAWRAWLLMYTLPAAVAAYASDEAPD
jgi:hypothetical protein